MKQFTEIEFETIKELFNQNKSLTYVAKELHTSCFSLKRECNLNGILIPKYTHHNLCLTNPFENIDKPDVKYWLGWIATDGYVNNEVLRLSVANKDIDILFKFKHFLGNKVKIHTILHHKKIFTIIYSNKE